MAASGSKLHHVVFCVRPENQDAAADFWRHLGLAFVEIGLEEEGLRVLLDWDAGIEIISPTGARGTETDRFERFLADHGEGVCSVVVDTSCFDDALTVAKQHGALVRYQQHREDGGFSLDEADLTPLYGMPVSFLSTNRPD